MLYVRIHLSRNEKPYTILGESPCETTIHARRRLKNLLDDMKLDGPDCILRKGDLQLLVEFLCGLW